MARVSLSHEAFLEISRNANGLCWNLSVCPCLTGAIHFSYYLSPLPVHPSGWKTTCSQEQSYTGMLSLGYQVRLFC